MNFYNLNGVITKTKLADFVFTESNGILSFQEENIFEEISTELERIDNMNLKKYVPVFQILNIPFFSIDGIDSESKRSKADFEKAYAMLKNDLKTDKVKEFNKILLHVDTSNLLDSLKNTLKESLLLFKQFYKFFNEHNFVFYNDKKNAYIISSSENDTIAYSLLSSSIIKLWSTLDILTKYCNALEELDTFNFEKYHELKLKVLFGNAKHLKKIQNKSNTIFGKNLYINILESLRNDFVHNCSLNSFNRIYSRIENYEVVEKFILLPDHTEGRFHKYINRNRFFSTENKLNEVLPQIFIEILQKIKNTLKCY